MSKIISECRFCHKKNVSEVSRAHIDNFQFITLDCGHTYSEKGIKKSDFNTIYLHDNRELYPFQVEGVRFLESSNFRALISDEMGLGKTIQAVGGLKLHFEDLKPILVITKASLTHQWLREIVSGTGKIAQVIEQKLLPIPGIEIFISSFDSIPPRKVKGKDEVKGGLIDTIKKLKIKTIIIDECQMLKNHGASRTNAVREIVRSTVPRADNKNPLKRAKIEIYARDLMKYHGIDSRFQLFFSDLPSNILGLTECKASPEGIIIGKITIQRFHAENHPESEVIEIILHEIAHAITPGAGHKSIWVDTYKAIGGNGERFAWCEGTVEIKNEEPSVKHLIALSGTPIKNNAIEYFPILNLLRPEQFPNRENFIRREVDFYWSGGTYKAGGLKYPEDFISRTSDFIIRRTRDQVLPDLPKIQRDYKYYPMMKAVMEAYNKKVKDLSDFMDEHEEGINKFEVQGELIAILQKLRHITGLAKLEPVIDYLTEFMEESETEKITVFHHHIDIGAILNTKLNELYPGQVIRIVSQDSSEIRMAKIDKFREEKISRILIAPTLACGEGINLQFCSKAILMEREWNPANEEQAEGRFSRIGSKSSSILINYPTATGTIDEFFAEIVERKREAITKSLDGQATPWDQSSIISDLAKIVVRKWRASLHT